MAGRGRSITCGTRNSDRRKQPKERPRKHAAEREIGKQRTEEKAGLGEAAVRP